MLSVTPSPQVQTTVTVSGAHTDAPGAQATFFVGGINLVGVSSPPGGGNDPSPSLSSLAQSFPTVIADTTSPQPPAVTSATSTPPTSEVPQPTTSQTVPGSQPATTTPASPATPQPTETTIAPNVGLFYITVNLSHPLTQNAAAPPSAPPPPPPPPVAAAAAPPPASSAPPPPQATQVIDDDEDQGASVSASSGNLQTFTGSLGGSPPNVLQISANTFQVEGNNEFNNLKSALQRSCDVQKKQW